MIEKISKSDWWVIIGFWVMATPIVVSDYISGMSFSKSIQMLFLDVFIISFVSIVTVYILAPKYLSRRRYLMFFIGLFGLLLVNSFMYFFGYVAIWSMKSPDSWIEFIADEIVSGGQSTGILAGILLAKKYFEGQQDVLKLEAETKANELRALQSQVNPHFLFNNLNSLDELIDSDPNEAKKYVNKLAQLYRYLINSKDNDVVTLKEEMAFAENYIYLLRQRYGDSYIFNVNSQLDDDENVLIPPASLQLILENVVKHNVGSIDNPLITNIELTNQHIVVTNEKRLKKSSEELGTGINNLTARYTLLSDLKIDLKDDKDTYSISLPLIPLLQE